MKSNADEVDGKSLILHLCPAVCLDDNAHPEKHELAREYREAPADERPVFNVHHGQ